MMRRRVRFAAAWLLCTSFGQVLANAHDLPLDRMMNAFVKIEPKQADLVVRVPLDLLRGVPFPLKESQYDLQVSGPATELALLLLEDGFVLQEDDVRLTPSASSVHLSPPSDRSFES